MALGELVLVNPPKGKKSRSSARGKTRMARTKTSRKTTTKRKSARKSPARRTTKAKRSAAAKKAWRTRRRNAGKKTTKRRASRKSSRKSSTSAKRRSAARKAAATRKRNASKRSRAAKKAAATRKRNSGKRRSAAKRGAAKRRTSKRKTTKRSTKAKRSAAAKKAWRTRRRNGTAKRRSSKRRTSKRRTRRVSKAKMKKGYNNMLSLVTYGMKAGALGLVSLGVFNAASAFLMNSTATSNFIPTITALPVLRDANVQAALTLGAGLMGIGYLMNMAKKQKLITQNTMNVGMGAFAGLLGARMLMQAPLTTGLMTNLANDPVEAIRSRLPGMSGSRSLGMTNNNTRQMMFGAHDNQMMQGAHNNNTMMYGAHNNQLQVTTQQVPNNSNNLFGTRSRSLRGSVNLF